MGAEINRTKYANPEKSNPFKGFWCVPKITKPLLYQLSYTGKVLKSP